MFPPKAIFQQREIFLCLTVFALPGSFCFESRKWLRTNLKFIYTWFLWSNWQASLFTTWFIHRDLWHRPFAKSHSPSFDLNLAPSASLWPPLNKHSDLETMYQGPKKIVLLILTSPILPQRYLLLFQA